MKIIFQFNVQGKFDSWEEIEISFKGRFQSEWLMVQRIWYHQEKDPKGYAVQVDYATILASSGGLKRRFFRSK